MKWLLPSLKTDKSFLLLGYRPDCPVCFQVPGEGGGGRENGEGAGLPGLLHAGLAADGVLAGHLADVSLADILIAHLLGALLAVLRNRCSDILHCTELFMPMVSMVSLVSMTVVIT